MATVVIECYDSGVRISDGNNMLADIASCALIEQNSLITVGESAIHQSHLRPREVSTTYWSDLAGNTRTKHIVSNAELALHHIKHAWASAQCDNEKVILITPATFDKNHLGILLGICKKLSINIVGMVCNATLAIEHPLDTCKAIHLDLLQESLVVTELQHSESNVEVTLPGRVFNHGLQEIIQTSAKTVAKKFIHETRFDPMHIAEDEQIFFNELSVWVNALKTKDFTRCKLKLDDNLFEIDISKQQLQQANQNKFEEIASHLNVLFHNYDAIAIFCSSNCKQAFGLNEYLHALPGCAVIQLGEAHNAKQALRYKREITNEKHVHYLSRLRLRSDSESMQIHFNSGKLSNFFSRPTHILLNNHAYSLNRDLYISSKKKSNEPVIKLNEDSNSICKISNNGINVEVSVLSGHSTCLNQTEINTCTNATIGDTLNFKGLKRGCQFIKVTQYET